MDLLKLKNISADSNHKSCVITDLADITCIVNTFVFCLENKKRCLITDNTKKIDKLFNEITVILHGKIYYLSWIHLIMTNKYLTRKYKQNSNFNITPNIFNIFFLMFIDKYYSKIDSASKNLIGSKNSYFGVYDSFNDYTNNVENKLYFSYNLFSFILYRIKEDDDYIMGKLFPAIKMKNDTIICDKKEYKCPSTFKKITDINYGIKKRKVLFDLQDSTPLSSHNLNKELDKFYLSNIMYNTYIIKIKDTINNCILQNLYKFIVNSYPFLDNTLNKVIYDTDNYDYPKSSINFFINKLGNRKNMILQIDSRYNTYISSILESISNYLVKLSTLNKVKVIPRTINYEYQGLMIHLVSEIYYIIVSLIIYLPYTIKKYSSIENSSYIHANYMFSNSEVMNLYKHKNNLFSSNKIYLQSILLKTLSIFTYDYYALMRTNNELDIIPIKKDMSNNTILNLINRSQKAELAKTLIWNTTNNIYSNINKEFIEQPYVIINIDEIDNSSINSTMKIYSKCVSNTIPIFINVLYNENDLHVSISFKKQHSNFKEAFDEIINQLVK